jgi:signal peptidase I
VTTDASAGAKRRPILAATLSLLVSGLGQLYNGQPKRAGIFFVGAWLLSLAFAAVIPSSFVLFCGLALLIPFAILWKIGAIADAFLHARRTGYVRLAHYNRWYVYIGVVMVVALVQMAIPYSVHRRYESFSIPSASNIPTLMPGDYIMSLPIAPGDIHRGDMVIFHLPKHPKISYVKRVIGMPGERVQLKAGRVFINDVPVVQSRISDFQYPLKDGHTTNRAQYVETLPEGKRFNVLVEEKGLLNDTPAVVVPENHYFVLGDERNNSLDSRVPSEVGFVPAASIYRKAAYVYWSKDWSRIGRPVE